jgi:hypothetical protein
MYLTAAEFCRFNLNSRIRLLDKDGELIGVRAVLNKYVVKIYRIYQFLVEVIIRTINSEVIKAEPVLNSRIIELYDLRLP